MAETGSSTTDLLHLRLIEFIASNNRLFKCEWPCIWPEFFFEFPQHENLSADFIREEFFNNVLPRIFTFNLSPQQNRYIRLLDEYAGLVRTENGYTLRSTSDILKEVVDGNLERGMLLGTFGDSEKVETASILIPPKDLDDLKHEFFADSTTQVWSSAIVATDEEIKNEILLPYKEIKKRVGEVQRAGEVERLCEPDSILKCANDESKFRQELQLKITEAIHSWRRKRHPGQ